MIFDQRTLAGAVIEALREDPQFEPVRDLACDLDQIDRPGAFDACCGLTAARRWPILEWGEETGLQLAGLAR